MGSEEPFERLHAVSYAAFTSQRAQEGSDDSYFTGYPEEMLRSIRRALKPNGQLVLLEYRKEDPKLPIHPNHRMSVSEVRTELEAEGLVFDRLLDGLPMQHILIFRNPRR